MRQPNDTRLIQRVTAALRSGEPQTIALGELPPVTVQFWPTAQRLGGAGCGEPQGWQNGQGVRGVSHAICADCFIRVMGGGG